MPPQGTFERVYGALRQQLRAGVYRPGQRLEPALLADGLHASVTPVRDALHRLAGERLVEAPPHEGFRVAPLTESMLRQLYAWHLDLLLLALSRRPAKAAEPASAFPQPLLAGEPDALFAQLAGAAGNAEHLHALRAVRDRLAPFALIERLMLDTFEADHLAISGAAASGDRRALRAALLQYHRRRSRIVPELLAAAQRGGGPAEPAA